MVSGSLFDLVFLFGAGSQQNAQTGMSAVKKGKILVISAPSGAGKTTLLKKLIDSVPGLVYSISATTRKPRPGEVEGEHYFFLTESEFRGLIECEALAEWELVHGNYYGTPKKFIDEARSSGLHVILDIDVYGKKKLDSVYPEATGILITAPSMEELERRLRARNTEEEKSIGIRLNNALKELDFAAKTGHYEYELVNDDLQSAQMRLVQLVEKIIDE